MFGPTIVLSGFRAVRASVLRNYPIPTIVPLHRWNTVTIINTVSGMFCMSYSLCTYCCTFLFCQNKLSFWASIGLKAQPLSGAPEKGVAPVS